VRLDEPGAAPEQLELLSSSLRRDLLELDVDDVVEVGEGEPPAGSRGIDVVAIGELRVSPPGGMWWRDGIRWCSKQTFCVDLHD
jgi:hypothetical protein